MYLMTLKETKKVPVLFLSGLNKSRSQVFISLKHPTFVGCLIVIGHPDRPIWTYHIVVLLSGHHKNMVAKFKLVAQHSENV